MTVLSAVVSAATASGTPQPSAPLPTVIGGSPPKHIDETHRKRMQRP